MVPIPLRHNKGPMYWIAAVAAMCFLSATGILTVPAIRATAGGRPLLGGASWLSIVLTDLVFLAVAIYAVIHARALAGTTLSTEGVEVQRPLRGRLRIPWADISRVSVTAQTYMLHYPPGTVSLSAIVLGGEDLLPTLRRYAVNATFD